MWFINTCICYLFQQKAVGIMSVLFYKHSSAHEGFTTMGNQHPASSGIFSIREKRPVSLSSATAEVFPLAHFWSPLMNLCLIPRIHVSCCSPHSNALLFFPNFLSPSHVFHLCLPICITHLRSMLVLVSNLIPLVNFSVSLQIIKKRLCGTACKRKHCIPKMGYRLVCISTHCFGTLSFV